MIDLKSALESVQYNTGALGNAPQQNQQQMNQGQNAGILATLLKKIIPSAVGGGAVPPVA